MKVCRCCCGFTFESDKDINELRGEFTKREQHHHRQCFNEAARRTFALDKTSPALPAIDVALSPGMEKGTK